MKARYIGDPSDAFEGPVAVQEHGYTFVKGEWVDVDEDKLGYRLAKLKGNPTFETQDSKRPKVDVEEVDEAAEAESLRAELDKRGVSYRKNASNAQLKKLLADIPPVEEPVNDPPVPAK